MFRALLNRFVEKLFNSFPEHACAYCGVLTVERLTRWVDIDKQVWRRAEYGLASHLGLPLHTNESGKISICSLCAKKPREAPHVGPWPQEILRVPQRSKMFLSFAKLNCNLGRTQSYSNSGYHNPYSTYRTLTGEDIIVGC